LEAMLEASQCFVRLDELQEKVDARIAELIGVEAAYVCSGAAAGLVLAAAACIAGQEPSLIACLPDTAHLRNEIVIERSHRNRYDHALRQAGARLLEYGYARGTEAWELEAAITPATVAVAYFVTNASPATLSLPRVAEIAHAHGLPVIVDAAAEVPPATNLRRFVDEGGDLVIFSGGKGLRGPQSTGLILGRRDLIAACAANSNPNHSIGRPMKVGKEELVGMLVALELYLAEPEEERQARWEQQVRHGISLLEALPGLYAVRVFPMPTGKWVPRIHVQIDATCPYSAAQLRQLLQDSTPSIEVRPDELGFFIDPQNLQAGEMELICRRIRDLLTTGEPV
jgi:uncharacterized pyridoxal phosphate-dependent enzyme